MRNETALHNELQSELEELAKIEVGSDKYKVAVDGVTKLADRVIEIEKLEADKVNKETEVELKTQQLKDEKRDKKIRNGIAIAGIVIPLTVDTVVKVWGTLFTTNFEKFDTQTTTAGKSFFNQLFRKS